MNMIEQQQQQDRKHLALIALSEFMNNLLQAGMSVEQVIDFGYHYAKELIDKHKDAWMHEADIMLGASAMVRKAADKLQISLEFQQRQVGVAP